MSTKRILKKQVNSLTQEFISDAFSVIGSHPDTGEAVISEISDVVELRNETIRKINHPDVAGSTSLRKSLNGVKDAFLKALDVSYRELSDITAGKKKTGGQTVKPKAPAKEHKQEKQEKQEGITES